MLLLLLFVYNAHDFHLASCYDIVSVAAAFVVAVVVTVVVTVVITVLVDAICLQCS